MKPAAKYGLIALVVVLVAGAAGVVWFLRDDSPDEVDLAIGAGVEALKANPRLQEAFARTAGKRTP